MSSKIVINDITLELNVLDADTMEKCETLVPELSDKVGEPEQYEGLTHADKLRLQCRHIRRFFDTLFEDGISEDLFPNKGDLGAHLDAVAQVVAVFRNSENSYDSIFEKYSLNRLDRGNEPRRNSKHKKRHPKKQAVDTIS